MSVLMLANVLFTARALGIALWVGLALLTVSLLVLMRTRFGQARPMSKCVVLSVLAHVLLLGYAWGTHLIFETPPPPADDYIAVTIRDAQDDRDAERRNNVTAEQLQPWERLPTDADTQPAVPAPERSSAAPLESPIRSERATSAPAVGGIPTLAVERSEPNQPVPPTPQDDAVLRHARSGVAAAPIEAAPPKRHEVVRQEGPDIAALRRPSDAAASRGSTPEFTAPDLPDELFNIKPRAQRLADPVGGNESADAAAGRDDLAAGAERDLRGDADSASAEAEAASGPLLMGSPAASPSVASAAAEPSAASPQHGVDEGAATGDALFESPGTLRRLGDGAQVPNLYRLRYAADRLRIVKQRGGDENTETAVNAALAWLAAAQEPDGRWSAARHGAGVERSVLGHNREGAGANADTAVTGLAVLAFLGAGHSHLEGRWRQHVQHGLEFLLRSQRGDGSLAGDARLFASMYCHGMAGLALGEAYAVTGDHRLKPFVERAAAYSLNSQDRRSGGWRYQPGDSGDMSQFGWQVMSLISAHNAGVSIPAESRSMMLRFLQSCASGRRGGLCSYRPGEGASRTMTAEGLSCSAFLRTSGNEPARREAFEYLAEELPDDGQADFYYWYYGTLALSQWKNDLWPRWNEALKRQLLSRQTLHGDLAGSWRADSRWGGYGGRVYSTALACLCLEVYYRYLPVYVENGQ